MLSWMPWNAIALSFNKKKYFFSFLFLIKTPLLLLLKGGSSPNIVIRYGSCHKMLWYIGCKGVPYSAWKLLYVALCPSLRRRWAKKRSQGTAMPSGVDDMHFFKATFIIQKKKSSRPSFTPPPPLFPFFICSHSQLSNSLLNVHTNAVQRRNCAFIHFQLVACGGHRIANWNASLSSHYHIDFNKQYTVNGPLCSFPFVEIAKWQLCQAFALYGFISNARSKINRRHFSISGRYFLADLSTFTSEK